MEMLRANFREIFAIFFLLACFLASSAALSQIDDAEAHVNALIPVAEGPVLVRKGPVALSLLDIVGHLDKRVPAEKQSEVIADPARLEAVIEAVALTEMFWIRAQQDGLLSDPRNQARVLTAAKQEMRAIYRERFLKDIELPNYVNQGRELFLTSPEDFMGMPTVDLEHILITVDQENGQIKAMKRVVEAYEQLQMGRDFQSVAAEYSDDPTFSDTKGFINDIELGSLVPSVASAVQTLEVGQYSLPVQSRFGWHIVRLVASKEGEQVPWEDAREQAEHMAKNKHLTESFERLLRDFNVPVIQYADGAIQQILDYYELDGFGVQAVDERQSQ